ncbi:MAG: response regulator [Deltaproteobacteria bacterium]|nr:response regulator [Deltaproteobacteria bacterium]
MGARHSVAEILLVEDNPADVRLTREAMTEAKVLNNLHVAADGEQALQFLMREAPFEDAPRPDLILLDLNLPRKDGREVLRVIKSTADLKRIPVVVLTTSKAEEDIAKTYDLHANCFITKPMDLEQFIHIVQHIEGFWLGIVALPDRPDPH